MLENEHRVRLGASCRSGASAVRDLLRSLLALGRLPRTRNLLQSLNLDVSI